MADMAEVYGPYPMIDSIFPHGYNASQASDDARTTSPAQHDASGGKLRRHAACDECRKRKLKCTGEPIGCLRCVKNGIPCIYSQQKQMGRPRKRQRTNEEQHSPSVDEVQYAWPLSSMPPPSPPPLSSEPQAQTELQSETPIDPSLSNIDHDLTDFHNICPGPMAQTIRSQRERRDASLDVFEHSGDSTSLGSSHSQYPTDISLWPDFSTLDKLPLPLTTKYDPDPSNDLSFATSSSASTANTDSTQPNYDPDTDPAALSALPAIPSCPCLPNLYLALSTLSTLSTFPFSQHTVDSLLSAHKTAHSVIYCPVCPQQYQSGSQNLMLGCTLLNVLADHWYRIRHMSPEVLKKGFGKPQQHNQTSGTINPNQPFVTVKEGQTWRLFVRQLIRAYVFGDAVIPKPPSPSSLPISASPESNVTTTFQDGPKVLECNTLHYLISALERRQRQWHNLDTPTDEFTDRSMHDLPGYAHVHVPDVCKSGISSVSTNDSSSVDADSTEFVNDKAAPGSKHHHGGHGGQDHGQGVENPPCLIIVLHSKNIVRGLNEQSLL